MRAGKLSSAEAGSEVTSQRTSVEELPVVGPCSKVYRCDVVPVEEATKEPRDGNT